LAQNGAKGKAENFYRLQNNAPASAPAPVAGAAFQPESELLAKVGADKQLKEARANERQLVMKPEPKPQAPGQQAQGGGGRGGNGQPAVQDPPAPQAERKIIRTGQVEYEIESFDSAVATISKIIAEEGGFVGTVNSDRLPNGKVRGTVVLRLAPDRLDILLLKLRGLGELKSQNIRSQDVTKQFYDLESRLRAARTMEERLLKIIKEGKGEIKDLLLAEKELGEWRTKIESFEGEIRYYASQISLSTLTVTLMEKEIRSPSAVTQTERVQMAVEVEDVEKSHKAALAAVVEAKGRVTRSELKQLAAGQFSALLQFEVAPDAAGLLRDRFKQLGNVARLDIDRVEETEGGSGKAGDVKVRQKDSQVTLSIYNLANVAPRETIVLSLACVDTEASYKAILARIEKAGGRVISSALNRMKNDQSSGSLSFEIKAADAEPVLLDVRAAGEVMRLDVTENPDTQNVTKSKRGFQVQIFSTGLVEPRETSTITIAAKSVPEAYAKLQDAAVKAGGRILVSQLNERDRQNVSATLQFDARRENEAGILRP
jgi:glycine cleavage system regulatory protein